MNTRHSHRLFEQSRRQFFQAAGVLSVAALAPGTRYGNGFRAGDPSLPRSFSPLTPLGDPAPPIPPGEFPQRIEPAPHFLAATPTPPSGSPSHTIKYDA